MPKLFGEDFRERADLQRRQIYHQQQLDAKSFNLVFKGDPRVHENTVPADERDTYSEISPDSEGRVFALIPLGVALLLVLAGYGVIGAALATAAALPVAVVLKYWDVGGWRAYMTAFIGIMAYLAFTVVIGFCAGLFDGPLASAIVDLRHLAPVTASHPLLLLIEAFLILHAPGMLVCAVIFAARIEEPFSWAASFAVMPVALAVAVFA